MEQRDEEQTNKPKKMFFKH